jgi:hypothetical protein
MGSLFISVGTLLVGALLSWIAALYWFRRDTQRQADLREADRKQAIIDSALREHERLVARIVDLEMKLSVLSQAVVPISTAFQAILIKELTHFHTPRMDDLMNRLGPPSSLSLAEETELGVLLLERERTLDGEISDSERDAAHILPIVIRRAKAEALAMEGKPQLFKLVTIEATRRVSDD